MNPYFPGVYPLKEGGEYVKEVHTSENEAKGESLFCEHLGDTNK